MDNGTEPAVRPTPMPTAATAARLRKYFQHIFHRQDSGHVTSTLTVTGHETLACDDLISGGSSTFTWSQHVSDTDSYTETDTDSDSDADSGTYIDSGDTDSFSEGETDTDILLGQ